LVTVTAPPQTQRARLLARPGASADKFEALIANQLPDAEKRRRADFVVDTSLGFDAARKQVADILRKIATMPKRRR
jgi:dephospho-CoA kinase